MKFCMMRLGKDSVDELTIIANDLEPGVQSTPHEFSIISKQVPTELESGSIVFIWLGSDNNKGNPTKWAQGIRAIGQIKEVVGGNYREDTTTSFSVGYVFQESVGRKDVLKYAPSAYYWCSDVPVIGVDDRSNQTLRMIDEGNLSSVPALLYSLAARDGDSDGILQVYPDLAPYFSYTPSNPLTGAPAPVIGHTATENPSGNDDFLAPEDRNMIFFGAPGTGKSYQLATKVRQKFSEPDKEGFSRHARVTFHPRYTYTQFVGVYKPVALENQYKDSTGVARSESLVSYDFVPGVFLKILVKALNNNDENYVLVIEEINRADTASVFGDIFQLLDRGPSGISSYPIFVNEELARHLDEKLTDSGKRALGQITGVERFRPEDPQVAIPGNLILWATMNSADQGVFPLDSAFKRRWGFSYVGINAGASLCTWDEERRAINNLLKNRAKVNEDRLLGPFFLSNLIAARTKDGVMTERFSQAFSNKVLMYLAEDAARYSITSILKQGMVPENPVFSDIFHAWQYHNFGIFDGVEPWPSPLTGSSEISDIETNTASSPVSRNWVTGESMKGSIDSDKNSNILPLWHQ